MTNLKRFYRAHDESGDFRDLVNIMGPADEHAFLTKSGETLVALSFVGIDPECLERDALESLLSRFRAALRVFDERFVVNTYLIKRSSPDVCSAVCGDDQLARELTARRNEFLRGKAAELYSFETFITVALRPDWKKAVAGSTSKLFARIVERVRLRLGMERQVKALGEELSNSLRVLYRAINGFLDQTTDCLEARILPVEEAFSLFRRLYNPDPRKAEAVPMTANRTQIDYFLVDSELECYRDHLRLDSYFIKTLTLKQVPTQTFADLLSDLRSIKADILVTTEWQAMEPQRALRYVRSRRRHAHNTKLSLFIQTAGERPYEREMLFDDSKEAVVEDLGDCLTAIEMKGVYLGEFTLSVIIYGTSLEDAERAASEIARVFGAHDAALHEERYNGLNAFLAALPAGYPYNLRRLVVTNENHADLVTWFQPAKGEARNAFLGTSSISKLETEDKSLFDLGVHVRDVAHTLVLGSTGSGKTFFVTFLVAHLQKYSPATFILDVGGSYRWLTKLFGGSYMEFRPERRDSMVNVFSLEPTESNLEFIFAFVLLMLESGDYRLTDNEKRELFDAIRSMYLLDVTERRLLTLSTTVSPRVGEQLKRWCHGGQYGQWFDHAEDNVTLARFQCIDFEGMSGVGLVPELLLFYFLHRIDAAVNDPAAGTTFKVMLADEAWQFLKHPITREYIVSAMRTWRKKNAGIILATQSLTDVLAGDAVRPIIENCPTKLLMGSPALDAQSYCEALRLTDIEVEKVRNLVPKRQLLLKREALSKVLNLNVDPRSYWMFTTNPFEAKRRQELVNELGLPAALDHLAGNTK